MEFKKKKYTELHTIGILFKTIGKVSRQEIDILAFFFSFFLEIFSGR